MRRILDSGCTFHHCPDKSWVDFIEGIDGGQVVLGNNKTCKVQGIGSITLRMYDETHQILEDVRYLPELERNLISLGALDHSGHKLKAEKGKMTVTFVRSAVDSSFHSNQQRDLLAEDQIYTSNI